MTTFLAKPIEAIRNRYSALFVGAICTALATPAFPAIPNYQTPSSIAGANGNGGAMEQLWSLFQSGGQVGTLVVGALLFIAGAIGMVWAIFQVMSNKGTVGDVAKIGIVSAIGIAFGTYMLTAANDILAANATGTP